MYSSLPHSVIFRQYDLDFGHWKTGPFLGRYWRFVNHSSGLTLPTSISHRNLFRTFRIYPLKTDTKHFQFFHSHLQPKFCSWKMQLKYVFTVAYMADNMADNRRLWPILTQWSPTVWPTVWPTVADSDRPRAVLWPGNWLVNRQPKSEPTGEEWLTDLLSSSVTGEQCPNIHSFPHLVSAMGVIKWWVDGCGNRQGYRRVRGSCERPPEVLTRASWPQSFISHI